MRGQPLTEEQKELIREYYFDERVGYRTIGAGSIYIMTRSGGT